MNAMGGVVGLVNNPSGNERLGILKNSYNIGEITDESSKFMWLGGIIGRNGYAFNRLPIIIQNCYCSSETQIGYNYWDGINADVPNVEGVVDKNELKNYELILGIDNWIKDTKLLNNGFPILKWQNKDN